MNRFLLFIALCLWVAVSPVSASDTEPPYIPDILIVNSDAEAADLEGKGVIIWHRRADMALAAVPRALHGSLGKRSVAPRRVFPHRAVPTLDIAKTYFDASLIHSGRDLPAPYTGSGVVVGFCDTGFDPNHEEFRDASGRSRVKRLIFYDEPQGIRRVMDAAAEIETWATDDSDETHATHVAGILAGGSAFGGYGGMAPGADIVAATSRLYDAGILAACEDIIDYARSKGQPAVINLSLGSYNGPHDGTSLFCRYLSLLGEEAVICIAAGNEGDDDNSYRMDFSPEVPDWRARVHSSDWAQFDMYGLTDVWSADERPVSMRFYIYDDSDYKAVYESAVMSADNPEVVISSETDPAFARFMTGTVRLSGRVSELNGRWVSELEYDTHTDIHTAHAPGTWARYNIAFEISGAPGVHADVNADCQYSRLVSWPGYPDPDAELSVSDIATGDNVVCVGMYNNRAEAPTIDGSGRKFNLEPLTVNHGSGYGTLVDGRVLPHTVAPGGWLVSACSGPYVDARPDIIPGLATRHTAFGREHYWYLNAGTSMSTPYVAGCVATWLEALPGLTVHDVLEAIGKTNTRDYPDPSDPRHGHGWFRPYRALRYLLGDTGVSCPGSADASAPRVVPRDGVVDVFNPGGYELTVTVVAADGVSVLTSCRKSEPLFSLDISHLPAGMYVVTVAGRHFAPASTKILR